MQQPFLIRHAAGIITLALIVTSVLPFRHLVWLDGPAHAVSVISAPIKQPLRQFGNWLAGGSGGQVTEGLQELELDRDRFRTWYFQQLDRTRRLESRIAELERGRSIGTLEVDQLTRRVTGDSSDLSTGVFEVRAGTGDGVTVNSVAVVRATQYVGRVVGVDRLTCDIQPFTDRSAGPIEGAIIIGSDERPGDDIFLDVLLTPDGRGGLRGEVSVPDLSPQNQRIPRPERGMTVRLRDAALPDSAQMLVLGEVERVEADPEQPLRPIVFVRPRVDLRRVSEVTIRIPREISTPASAGGLP